MFKVNIVNKDPWYHTPNGEEKGGIRYLSIAVTGVCNLNCSFCYVNGSKKGSFSLEKLKQVLEESLSLGLQKVQITGGEPLLYEYLSELISFLCEKKVQIMLVTNGTLINERWAEFLSTNKVILGISLESLNSKIEASLNCQEEVFSRKIKSIKLLKKYGYTEKIPLFIITKPLKSNLAEIPKLWKWAVDMGIQPILDRAIPNPRLSLEDIPRSEDILFLLDFLHGLIGCDPPCIPFVCNEGCNRLKDGLHVEYNGDVLPCGGMKLILGNVFRENLRQILKKEIVRKLRDINSQLRGSCGKCRFKNICYGCRAIAYEIFGDIYAPDPYCWNYKEDEYDLKLDWDKGKLLDEGGKLRDPEYLRRLKVMRDIPGYIGNGSFKSRECP